MNNVSYFEPVYRHHDLLIELGRLEMAMEHLSERGERERDLRPRLEQRMTRVREALQHMTA
jgi:hypothetical protein